MTCTKIRILNKQLVGSLFFAANNQLDILNHRLASRFNKLINKHGKDSILININCLLTAHINNNNKIMTYIKSLNPNGIKQTCFYI